MKGVVDLNKYREVKERKNKMDSNTELLKEIISKKELSAEDYLAYSEINVIFSILYKEKYDVIGIEFRGTIHIINSLGDGTFEYLETFENVLSCFV